MAGRKARQAGRDRGEVGGRKGREKTSIGEDVEKLEQSYIAGGNVK